VISPLIKTIHYKETWPIRHQVMWPNQPLDYVKLPEDDQGLHFGLFDDDALISVVSLFMDGASAQFRKFATLNEYQGKGLGSQLLSYTFKQAQSQGVNRIWCNARLDKTNFYQRFGMIQTNELFTKGGIEYVIMERVFDPE